MKKEEKRNLVRFPYKGAVGYMTMGQPSHQPDKEEAVAEIIDLSDKGMRMRIEDRRLEVGLVLLIKVPVAGSSIRVPSLGEVRWIKEERPGAYQTGISFII